MSHKIHKSKNAPLHHAVEHLNLYNQYLLYKNLNIFLFYMFGIANC